MSSLKSQRMLLNLLQSMTVSKPSVHPSGRVMLSIDSIIPDLLVLRLAMSPMLCSTVPTA